MGGGGGSQDEREFSLEWKTEQEYEANKGRKNNIIQMEMKNKRKSHKRIEITIKHR